MIRSIQVPNGHTAARLRRLRILLTAFLDRQLMREDIADLLCLSPSGVRKYVKDLAGIIGVARYVEGTETFIGFPVYQLAIRSDQVEEFLEQMTATAPTRTYPGRPSSLSRASKDPRRHFHILADDAHYAIRVSRAPVTRDPMVAAFFGPAPTAMGAHA